MSAGMIHHTTPTEAPRACKWAGCGNLLTATNMSGYCARHRHAAEQAGRLVTLPPEPEWRELEDV